MLASLTDRPSEVRTTLSTAILLAGCLALTLALGHLAYHYLRLSEAYARLILH